MSAGHFAARAEPAPSRSPSPWLVSARFDLAAFVVPVVVALALGAAAGRLADPEGRTPTWAWVALVLLVDVAHVHGTTVRVYLDPAELARRPLLYAAVPLVALAVGVAAYQVSPLAFWRLLAYVAVVHFVRQQIGWLRLYRRRAGESGRLDRALDEATIYAATLYPLLAWHAEIARHGPPPFEWFVAGDFVAWVPPRLVEVARPLWALLLASFGARALWSWRRSGRFATGKALLVATTAITWWAGIVLWRNDFAFTATNVLAHGVPYLAVSFVVGERGPAEVTRRTWLARAVFRRGRFVIYAALLGTFAWVEEWLWDRGVWAERATLFPGPALDAGALWPVLVPLLALPQLTHYILDGYLWRLDGSNPGLDEALGLRG